MEAPAHFLTSRPAPSPRWRSRLGGTSTCWSPTWCSWSGSTLARVAAVSLVKDGMDWRGFLLCHPPPHANFPGQTLFRSPLTIPSCSKRPEGNHRGSSWEQPARPGSEPDLQPVHRDHRGGPPSLPALQSSHAWRLRLRSLRGSSRGLPIHM